MERKLENLVRNVNEARHYEEGTRDLKFAYSIQGAWYSSEFPIKYAVAHDIGTGPLMCKRCRKYGVDANGLFVKYCRLCQKWYDGEIDNFVEKKEKFDEKCKREVSFSESEDEKNNDEEFMEEIKPGNQKDSFPMSLLQHSVLEHNNVLTPGNPFYENNDSDNEEEEENVWFDVEFFNDKKK